jgi:hypothetical protein
LANLTAQELANISNPAENYLDGASNAPPSSLTADQLADISNPAANYDQPIGLTPDEQSTFGVPSEAYLEDNTPKSSNVTDFDEKGGATGKTEEPNLNKDTAALTQVGVYQNPGFFSDQSMKNSDTAFNKAVNIATAVSGFGSFLQNTKPPQNYVRTAKNYILTDREKEAIDKKSTELSLLGVIPYDVLRSFFYILAAVENKNELAYIAQVTGIPELESEFYVRNIIGILNINEIYKVGYLANGVASVLNTYASKYSTAVSYANPNSTSFGNVNNALEISRALGVLGPIILSTAQNLNGNLGILQNSSLSSSAIQNAVGAVSQLASGAALNLITAASHPTSLNIKSIATQVGVNVVKNLLSQSPLGGALSQFGILGGIAGGPLLQQFGGMAIGNFMSELLTGSRIPTQKIANNPSLRAPSYAGKAFFGETPCALPAVDQLFCRRVGSFGNASGGSGADSFGMQNFASFGGVQSISSIVSKMVTGSSFVPPATSYFAENLNSMVSDVCNVLNVATTATIEMRRSDNAIPFMIGFSAAVANESFSPFESKISSDGWKVASSAANDIQKTNPQFIEACKTSL